MQDLQNCEQEEKQQPLVKTLPAQHIAANLGASHVAPALALVEACRVQIAKAGRKKWPQEMRGT